MYILTEYKLQNVLLPICITYLLKRVHLIHIMCVYTKQQPRARTVLIRPNSRRALSDMSPKLIWKAHVIQ